MFFLVVDAWIEVVIVMIVKLVMFEGRGWCTGGSVRVDVGPRWGKIEQHTFCCWRKALKNGGIIRKCAVGNGDVWELALNARGNRLSK